MKFKNAEEVIKYYKEMFGEHSDKLTFGDGVRDAFKSFVERKNFYEKYKDRPEEFRVDYSKEFESSDIAFEWAEQSQWYQTTECLSDWKNWLFNHCFGDVM